MENQNQTPAQGTKAAEILALIERGKTTFLYDINMLRAEIVRKKKQYDKMGGEDNYESGILELVNEAGKTGITAAELHVAFPDGFLITAARTALKHLIASEKEGMTWRLTPIITAPTAAVIDVEAA